MRHYEIILMVHPDKSEKISHIIEFYSNIIRTKKGIIHRLEDWGQRPLSYMINKLKKAHYVLMNIEVSINCMQYLENNFKFNLNIIRHFILLCCEAFKKKSPMLQTQEHIKKELTSVKNTQNKVIIK
ncbi:30S ribosomal protein S6 [Buchnera aphidicola (Cinara kochiana kochiana)]|uniref:Small ribosomal subunit protein bS6 n=1 Tax=Buchnera aphidicola (Cinara kochiana kochiana) TaxID=2518976 RepID=A0A451D691_9GAMM|nr:30S ribosomal protein S6 [Buchnera aphidicola]VFP81275.1 30S ribosomal protein S6 [Buchnera aphidicola (Cinara kochiana kochiana)]